MSSVVVASRLRLTLAPVDFESEEINDAYREMLDDGLGLDDRAILADAEVMAERQAVAALGAKPAAVRIQETFGHAVRPDAAPVAWAGQVVKITPATVKLRHELGSVRAFRRTDGYRQGTGATERIHPDDLKALLGAEPLKAAA